MLPDVFRRLPITHRALHDVTDGRPENSRAAIRAAIDAGYGIEIDLQLSSDGEAMVFHDETLDRLAEGSGLVKDHTVAELAAIALKGGDGETIPTLRQILDLVAGRVPLLIEIKDQDGQMGEAGVGPLERATAAALKGYDGPVALMSFNPHAIAAMAELAPEWPRGLTTAAYDPVVWKGLDPEVCARLRDIPDYDRVGASFISHEWQDLSRSRVAELKDAGAAILCWTIKSPAEEAQAREIAVNVTFEQYLSDLPA